MTTESKKDVKKLDFSLSNSSISTFNQCPRKFYYQYVLRLPQKQQTYFILGTLVHYVLELFFCKLMGNREKKIKTNLGQLMGECFAQAREETPEATALILVDAKNILQDYLFRVIAKQKLPKNMTTEEKFNIEVEGVKVTGVIDRLDFGEGGEISIVDYKTGKKMKTKGEFAEDLQLPLYAIAVQKVHEIPLEKISCKLDHLKVRSEQNLQPTDEIIGKAIKKIVKCHEDICTRYERMEAQTWSQVGPTVVPQIKEHKEWSMEFESKFIIFITRYSKYWEPNPGWYCRNCDYYKICQNVVF